MILVDYNGIAYAALYANNTQADKGLLKHLILNTLRLYNARFRNDYGKMVVCAEGTSWRKNTFPQYKANREATKDDKIDWDSFYQIIHELLEDIRKNIPWIVLQDEAAEADDIIGVLAREVPEKSIIVSNDHDFFQLHSDKVSQFLPMKEEVVRCESPKTHLMEKVFKGDSGDGVPNILSYDSQLVDHVRQKPITKKKINEWSPYYPNMMDQVLSAEQLKNFQRNRLMIDLTFTPDEVKKRVLNILETYKPRRNTFNYLFKEKLNNLIEVAGDFTT